MEILVNGESKMKKPSSMSFPFCRLHAGMLTCGVAAMLAMSPVDVHAQAAPMDPKDRAIEISTRENILRQEKYLIAEDTFFHALKELEIGSYPDADAKLDKAKELLGDASKMAGSVPAFSAKVKKLREDIAKAEEKLNLIWTENLIKEAEKSADAKKLDEAVAHLDKARSMVENPDKKLRDRIQKLDDSIKKQKNEIRFKEETRAEAILLDKAEDDMAIAIALERGRVFMQNGRYADARDAFERVLERDLMNTKAMKYLKELNNMAEKVANEKSGRMMFSSLF